MRQRGRPPHPDILTPREWEVLSLLRERLSNREIGDRLNVTRDGIKYHVAQILLKLGVSTREEAAAWHPAPVAVAPANRLVARLSGISRLGLIGSAGVLLTGLVALGGAVAYNEIAGGSSPSNPAEVSAGGPPTASPGPYGVPTPSPFGTPAPPAVGYHALGSVAYVQDGNLWLLNLDTGDDHVLMQREIAPSATARANLDSLAAIDPEWSADGEWIAAGIRDSGDRNFAALYLVRASDGYSERFGAPAGWEWSPTELLIYANPDIGWPEVDWPPNYEHYASGRDLSNVGWGDARWSPDGRYLVVGTAQSEYIGQTCVQSAKPPYGVAIIDSRSVHPTSTPSNQDPAGVTTIYSTDTGLGPPIIHSSSPDGKYILFWTSDSR